MSQIHTFPYSRRGGTVGAKAEDQVPDDIKNKRADSIKKISAQKHDNFISQNIGTVQEVLIEKHPDKKSGRLKGMTRNYLTVLINSNDLNLTNTLQKVKLDKYENGKIYGSLV